MPSATPIARPSLRPGPAPSVTGAFPPSEILVDFQSDQTRPDDIVIEDPAGRTDPVGVAADRLAALDRAVHDAAAIEHIGREPLGAPVVGLHADADVGGRIGLEIADDRIPEGAQVRPALAYMVYRAPALASAARGRQVLSPERSSGGNT